MTFLKLFVAEKCRRCVPSETAGTSTGTSRSQKLLTRLIEITRSILSQRGQSEDENIRVKYVRELEQRFKDELRRSMLELRRSRECTSTSTGLCTFQSSSSHPDIIREMQKLKKIYTKCLKAALGRLQSSTTALAKEPQQTITGTNSKHGHSTYVAGERRCWSKHEHEYLTRTSDQEGSRICSKRNLCAADLNQPDNAPLKRQRLLGVSESLHTDSGRTESLITGLKNKRPAKPASQSVNTGHKREQVSSQAVKLYGQTVNQTQTRLPVNSQTPRSFSQTESHEQSKIPASNMSQRLSCQAANQTHARVPFKAQTSRFFDQTANHAQVRVPVNSQTPKQSTHIANQTQARVPITSQTPKQSGQIANQAQARVPVNSHTPKQSGQIANQTQARVPVNSQTPKQSGQIANQTRARLPFNSQTPKQSGQMANQTQARVLVNSQTPKQSGQTANQTQARVPVNSQTPKQSGQIANQTQARVLVNSQTPKQSGQMANQAHARVPVNSHTPKQSDQMANQTHLTRTSDQEGSRICSKRNLCAADLNQPDNAPLKRQRLLGVSESLHTDSGRTESLITGLQNKRPAKPASQSVNTGHKREQVSSQAVKLYGQTVNQTQTRLPVNSQTPRSFSQTESHEQSKIPASSMSQTHARLPFKAQTSSFLKQTANHAQIRVPVNSQTPKQSGHTADQTQVRVPVNSRTPKQSSQMANQTQVRVPVNSHTPKQSNQTANQAQARVPVNSHSPKQSGQIANQAQARVPVNSHTPKQSNQTANQTQASVPINSQTPKQPGQSGNQTQARVPINSRTPEQSGQTANQAQASVPINSQTPKQPGQSANQAQARVRINSQTPEQSGQIANQTQMRVLGSCRNSGFANHQDRPFPKLPPTRCPMTKLQPDHQDNTRTLGSQNNGGSMRHTFSGPSTIAAAKIKPLISSGLGKINKKNIALEGGGEFVEGQAYSIRDRYGKCVVMVWKNGDFVRETAENVTSRMSYPGSSDSPAMEKKEPEETGRKHGTEVVSSTLLASEVDHNKSSTSFQSAESRTNKLARESKDVEEKDSWVTAPMSKKKSQIETLKRKLNEPDMKALKDGLMKIVRETKSQFKKRIEEDVKEKDSQIRNLEKRLDDAEEKLLCAICMERQRNMAFLCGHSVCRECGELMNECPMCRKPVEQRITLY